MSRSWWAGAGVGGPTPVQVSGNDVEAVRRRRRPALLPGSAETSGQPGEGMPGTTSSTSIPPPRGLAEIT